MNKAALILVAAALAVPGSAKDALGTFSGWGAFRDPSVPRCYAIAKSAPSTLRRDYDPYASIGTWPKRKVRGQVYFRLSRAFDATRPIILTVGAKRFTLRGSGGNAWAQGRRMDAAIVAAMRSASSMTIRARQANGRRFSNTYNLAGAATAMDAAIVGCARRS